MPGNHVGHCAAHVEDAHAPSPERDVLSLKGELKRYYR
jgi:hypothetical protein